MNKGKSGATKGNELRRRAEELSRAKGKEARVPQTEAESLQLLHELEVHQVELEMQNEELLKARNELESILAKYTDLYDFAPVGYFTLDRAGVIRGVNLNAASLLGVERSLLIGRHFGQFFSREARPAFTAFLDKVFASQDKETYEAAFTEVVKRPLHLLMDAVACASSGECRVAVIDVTSRKIVEENLRKSERQLAEAQSIAHIGSWEWDSISDKVSGSVEFSRIFGLVLSTYDSFIELVHPDDRETVNKAVQDTLAHQAPYDVYYRIIRPDGITRVIHARGKAETDFAGRTVRMIGTCQDFTERRELEEKLEILNAELAARAAELEIANSELNAFNAAVSHDLRTPLSNINGFCQVLLNLYAEQIDKSGHDILKDIYSSTLRMNDLITTFLKFSQISQCVIVRQMVDLGIMAKNITAELARTSPDRRAMFRIDETLTAEGDAALLRIVLDNLLGNAWKYSSMKKEAVVEFGMTESDGKTAYFVRDNGAGFDMAFADKIFVPFQRLYGSNEFKGHGIGLATVQRIIQRHGGRVWAEGEPGRGATFYFTLQDN